MEVVSAAEHVFLDGELFFDVHVSSEITVVTGDEITASTLGASVFDDHGAVDVVRVFHHFGHGATSVLKPLALECTAALPVEDVSIAEGGDFQVPEIVRTEVFDQ